MSTASEQIIKGLLQLNTEKRLTATQVREQLKAIIDSHNIVRNTDHLVPEIEVNTDDTTPQTPPSETPFKEKWKKVPNTNTTHLFALPIICNMRKKYERYIFNFSDNPSEC